MSDETIPLLQDMPIDIETMTALFDRAAAMRLDGRTVDEVVEIIREATAAVVEGLRADVLVAVLALGPADMETIGARSLGPPWGAKLGSSQAKPLLEAMIADGQIETFAEAKKPGGRPRAMWRLAGTPSEKGTDEASS